MGAARRTELNLALSRGKSAIGGRKGVVLGKSLIFAILLLAFHLVEEAIRAWFEGKPLSEAFADLGGTLPGLLSYAAIFFVALIPFFAFREAGRILGNGALWDLFLHSDEKRFRLVEDWRKWGRTR